MVRLEATQSNYEGLERALREMPPARSGDRRQVLWAGSNGVIGLARDPQGRIEIFIAGPRLICTSVVVAEHLSYDAWQRADEDVLQANQLRLPAAPHFDAIAAFLCTHLLDSGADDDPQAAFARSEPVIEIAFDRLRLHGEAVVGLCGEILVLRALLDRRPGRTAEILAGWEGYGRSARDFHFGALGLEVKTTRGSTSKHRVQGIRQVEVGHGRDGQPETELFLVSVGVEDSDDGASGNEWTLPELVESVVTRIRNAAPEQPEPLIEAFLGHVLQYGTGQGAGYDHAEMHHRIVFGQRYRTVFVRAYDMTDPAIAVLRRPDLLPYPMVDADSVEFSIDLPTVVNGDINPVAGLRAATEKIAVIAWG